MRQTLRPENARTGWTYATTIVGDVPAEVIEIGRKMNMLWNELVRMHNRLPSRLLYMLADDEHYAAKEAMRKKDKDKAATHRAERDRLRAVAKSITEQSYGGFNPQAVKEVREQIKALRATASATEDVETAKQLRREAKTLRQDVFSVPRMDIPFTEKINEYVQTRGRELGLPVWCYWHVGDKFKTAVGSMGKRGAPKIRRSLDRINIEHRTDSGKGWDTSEFFMGRRKALSLRPEKERDGCYEGWLSAGTFQAGHTSVPIQVTLHRPFPGGAIVKKFSLKGVYEKAFHEWRWRLVFQMEIPPANVIYPLTGRIAGIDTGWRVREDGIRVFTLHDGHDFYELVIPYDLANYQERKDGRSTDIRDVWQIQAERDHALEQCKAQIRTMDKNAWPIDARTSVRGLTRMRSGGLVHLRNVLAQANIDLAPVTEWLALDGPLWRRQRIIQIRWEAARNHIYQNFAAEIARQFDAVAWEDRLNLKDMAEADGEESETRIDRYASSGEWEPRTSEQIVLLASQRARHTVAPSIARQYLRLAMAKRGREIIDGGTVNSSRECRVCGAFVPEGAALYLVCDKGHRQDQDCNAAAYEWQAHPEDLRAVAGVYAPVDRSQILRYFRRVSPSG